MADIYGLNTPDSLVGTNGADRIYGWAQTNPPNNFGPASDADTLRGAEGDDQIFGGGGADTIDGGSGADKLHGGAGNDTLYGDIFPDAGIDLLDGGAGDDFLVDFYGQRTTVSGSDGADRIAVGYVMGGIVSGGAGEDTLELVNNGAAAVRFGTTLRITGVETFYTGNLLVSGTAAQWESFDTIRVSFDDAAGGVSLGVIGGGTLNLADEVGGRNLQIQGSNRVDRITSGDGVDRLLLLGGNDLGYGGRGNDSLDGGAGNDALYGEGDDDTLTGSTGDDRLIGGAGIDSLLGGDGNDTIDGGGVEDSNFDVNFDVETIDGGAGTDWLTYGNSNAEVEVDLSAGAAYAYASDGRLVGQDSLAGIENVTGSDRDDVIEGDGAANVLSGGRGNDTLSGGAGADTLNGGAGQNLLVGGSGSDRIIGSGLIDLVSYEDSGSAVNVNLTTGRGAGGDAAGDVLSGIEYLGGSDFNDTLTGARTQEYLLGGDGDDVLVGSPGADFLVGGGFNSDDLFVDNDRASYAQSNAAVRVELFKVFSSSGAFSGIGVGGHAQGDVLLGITDLTGSRFADVLTGYVGFIPPDEFGIDAIPPGRFDGGAGNDTLQGGFGGDTLIGGAGVDTVSYSRATMGGLVVNLKTGQGSGNFEAQGDRYSGIENVTGSKFSDVIVGTATANRLNGFDGADRITGGGGKDTLIGGAKADLFVYGSIADSGGLDSQRDVILDFSRAEHDRLNLSAIDANTKAAGNQAFSFIGEAGFGRVAGQLRYLERGDDLVVAGDVNGDGRADFSVHLNDVGALTRADFIL